MGEGLDRLFAVAVDAQRDRILAFDIGGRIGARSVEPGGDFDRAHERLPRFGRPVRPAEIVRVDEQLGEIGGAVFAAVGGDQLERAFGDGGAVGKIGRQFLAVILGDLFGGRG